ncbi:MAG: hypothetical protein NSGCLCUN01_00001 [uncultured Clostridium sp.]
MTRKLGTIGVYTFLLITGYYLIPKENIKPLQYIKNKFKSMYPLYLVSITIIYILSFSGYLGKIKSVSIISFIANVFMINDFFYIPYVDGAHWYITYLIIYIGIISLMIFTKKQYSCSSYLILLAINLFLNKFVSLPKLHLLTGGYYLPVVVIGILMRNYMDTKFTKIESICTFIICCISISLMIGFSYCIIAIMVSIIIWNATNNKFIKLNNCKIFISIGNISYIIYLIHQNIGYMIMNYLNLKFEIEPFSLAIIVSLIIIVLSYIIKYIENKLKFSMQSFREN